MSQSPELAGGAGFTFEGSVGALYLASLLAEGFAPGIDNRAVCRVAFQQRDFGEPLDDIIVDSRSATGDLARLSLQAKRSLVISQAKTNTDFCEVVRDCWLTLQKPGFRRQQDRYGAAVGSVAKDKVRALNTLCEFARESVTVDHFTARFVPGGNASTGVRAVRNDIEALLLEVRGESCSDVEVKDFLAHFVLIEFDFLHDGAVDPPQAMSRVRDCLLPAEAGKAPLVWSHLVNLARTSAGKAGEYDRARLVRSVSEVAGLRVAVSLKPDLDKLVTLARSYVDGIQDDIGGVKLDRPSLSVSLDDKLAASRLIQIKGLPGSGKSVLLRQRVERALGRGPVLFLKADQIDGRNWIGFASAHGLSGAALQDLLVEIGAIGTPVLYIDAIDRVEKENQSVVLDVLRQITRSQVLENWRIVVSVRDAGIEMLRNWMADILDNVSVASVSVGSLDDDEAEVIATAKPQLRSLLFGTQAVRDVVRRPFFTKILNQNYTANANGPQFEPASEVDLIENWWARGGYSATGQDAIARQRAIVELAGLRSRKLSEPIALRLLSQPSVALLDQLILDGILQEFRRGHSVRFSHDIFFEWAFFHALTDRNDDWLEEIRSCGEPPAVSRVVELLAQWEYSRGQGWGAHLARVAGSQMRSQWTRAWLLGPMGISNFSADEGQFANVAFEEDFRFLKKALVWFQAEKTIPNQDILASNLPQDQRQRFADLLGWPADFSAWRRLISFLLHHVSEIPVRLYPDILSVFEVWQNAFADLQLRTSQAILEKGAEWLAELDAAEVERSWDRPSERWGSISGWDEFRKSLSNLVLKGSRSEPSLVDDYLRRLMTSKRLLRDRFEDIVAFSPRLSQTHSKLLVDFALAYLKQELPDDRLKREREEAARNAERRRQVLAKPEAERTRLEQLMADAPSPLIGGGISHFEREELCVDRDFRNFWPESPLREPFHSLFQSSPDEALRLLRELCNHAMTAWRQFHRYRDYYEEAVRTPLPLEIAFPWGTQKFWGTDRIYQWFRAFSAPKPLGCGFMC
ncbi:MAG: hypothetical protein HRU81_04585 [Gammaproteobacteria bacterium]|nr:MAG: hypothetical protein HRU81_04585 [Gammaproteobacteria bacterium]